MVVYGGSLVVVGLTGHAQREGRRKRMAVKAKRTAAVVGEKEGERGRRQREKRRERTTWWSEWLGMVG